MAKIIKMNFTAVTNLPVPDVLKLSKSKIDCPFEMSITKEIEL